MTLRLSLALRFSVAGGFPAEVSSWQARAAANGGSIDGQTLNAATRFIQSATAKGYRSKLKRLNLFAGNNLAAALTPLIVDAGPAADTNYNFVAGDYSISGLQSVTDAKYLDVGVIASSIGYNDAHLSFYGSGMEITAGTAAPGMIGCRDAVTTANRFVILAYHPGGSRFATLGAPNAAIAPTNSIASGLLIASADASGCYFYQNTVLWASVGRQAGAFGNASISVFTWLPGIGGAGTNALGKSYSIGTFMTAADTANFYADLQTFFMDIGRGV